MDVVTAGIRLREVANLHGRLQLQSVACCGGTTGTQCSILTELGRSGPVTLADLGRRVGLDKGWLSRAVEALVQEGLVRKETGATDRRTVSITLTAAGEARCQELNQTLNGFSERVLGRIAPADQPAVTHALALLEAALRAELAEPAWAPVRLEVDAP